MGGDDGRTTVKRTRESIEADLRAYLASGRKITKVSPGASGEVIRPFRPDHPNRKPDRRLKANKRKARANNNAVFRTGGEQPR